MSPQQLKANSLERLKDEYQKEFKIIDEKISEHNYFGGKINVWLNCTLSNKLFKSVIFYLESKGWKNVYVRETRPTIITMED